MATRLHLYMEALSKLSSSAPREDSCVHHRRDQGLSEEQSPLRQSPIFPYFLEMSEPK